MLSTYTSRRLPRTATFAELISSGCAISCTMSASRSCRAYQVLVPYVIRAAQRQRCFRWHVLQIISCAFIPCLRSSSFKKGRELIVDPYTHLKTSMIFDTTLSVVIAWSIRKTSCRLHINNKNMPLILSGLK